MAKVIFEFEIGEEDDLISLHMKARAMERAINGLAEALRGKTKYAPNKHELGLWLPLAMLFKDHVDSDLYDCAIPTDYPHLGDDQ